MSDKKPEWVKMKPSEVEKIVVELAKKGETPEKIGLILRDTHGIPKVRLVGKKISKILTEANLPVPTQKQQIEQKINKINKHITKNKHDYTAQRSLNKSMWVANKLK